MSPVRLMDGHAYKKSLQRIDPEIYALGERITDVTEHPLTRPHVESAALTYELAHREEYRDLLLTKSSITHETINRFTHIHQSRKELIKKVKMLRLIGQKSGSCFQRCVGFDALNALFITTFNMDKGEGTNYHQRFLSYLRMVQEHDLMVAGAMTDPKGDRSKKPHEQEDPDLYLRIVDQKKDGVVVRGAKIHITGAVNSHEILVMPTTALGEKDRDYAVSFALPLQEKGIKMVFGRQTNDLRRISQEKLDQGNSRYGVLGGEALVIFDDVFVPRERLFMCGEYKYAGAMVETFASFHRQNYGGCKVGISDLIIGAVTKAVEHLGITSATHVQSKVAEMIRLAETLYAGSISCSAEGSTTHSGACFVNPLLANTTKLNVTEYIYEIARLAHDLIGGIVATLPSQHDLQHKEMGPYLQKYLQAHPRFSAEERVKIIRLIENLTGGISLVESMHGAGSPQAQRIMLLRGANLPQKIEMVEDLLKRQE